MTSAWFGTVGEFIKKADEGILVSQIQDGYQRQFKKIPGSGEISSWEHSIELLRHLLHDDKWHGLWIYFEYPMPSGEQRADIILLGGDEQAPKGLVLELKRWDRFDGFVDADWKKLSRRVRLSKFEDKKTVLHPLLQARKYALQLANGSEVGSRFSWSYVALLPNMPVNGIQEMLNTNALPDDASKTLFGQHNFKEGMSQKLAELIPAKLSTDIAGSFNVSGYAASQDLIDKITKNAPALMSALNSVRDIGIEPTDAQWNLCIKILDAVRLKEHKLFLVEGGPGSGKTFIAILLLLRTLASSRKAKLAVYSSRLLAVIEDCLDSVAEGASALIMNVGPLAYQIRSMDLDLLICDEAQRFSETQIKKILGRGTTTVMLYDERQRLNPVEEGTKEVFHRVAHKSNLTVVEEKLEIMMRCAGGNAYHEWVERIISGDAHAGGSKKQSWSNNYSFEVVDTCKDMIDKLHLYGNANKVVVTASFTENPGDYYNQKSDKNTRYRDEHVTLYWWMYDHQYIEPWAYGRTQDLDRVCSIYGTQGFESDYVGVVWGRDYIFDGSKFILGDFRKCFDRKKVEKEGLASEQGWCKDALTLLQNRYRIFLTRGRLGTIIYAEDENTRAFLKNMS